MNKYSTTISLLYYISVGFVFSQASNQLEIPNTEEIQTPILYREYGVKALPLENPIDPDQYYLGPGDRLRINISSAVFEEKISKEWAVENVDNYVTVSPTGDLIIPKVGIINVLGKTLTAARQMIEQRALENNYREAQVSISLIRIRQFSILVYGAVNNPGFYIATPITRVLEVINSAGGVQKYGDPEKVFLYRKGKQIELKIKAYLVNGVLDQNPLLKDGDKIFVPFFHLSPEKQFEFTEYKKSKVIVNGFVYRPKRFDYLPGYTVRDYVALSGGVMDIGSLLRVKIIRANGKTFTFAINEPVEPGDIIQVPEKVTSVLFGDLGLIQSITSIATLILAYKATLQ